jgi:hypothetical protein
MRGCLLFIFVFYFFNANAQILRPSIINNGGGSTITPNVSLDWSIGEAESITNYLTSSLFLGMGVLNNALVGASNIDENTNAKISAQDFLVWPNPTTDIVNIKTTFTESGFLNMTLYDVKGSVINHFESVAPLSSFNKSFNLDELSSGTYLLKVVFSPLTKTEKQGIFKIIKVNK